MPITVSIITPSYQHAHFLPATIESVLMQSYPHIEYIVLDGNSKDGTLEILEGYTGRLQWHSEPDNGQTDAINKGWRMATGDILAWLNSDDAYFPDTVEKAVAYFEAHPDAMWVYGDPVAVDEQGRDYPFRDAASQWDYQLLLHNNFITQPTVFLRREVAEEIGYLDDSLNFIMDYEYWLRIGKRYDGHYVPGLKARVTRYRSTKTVSGGFPRMAEIERIVSHYGGNGLPKNNRPEWVIAGLEEGFSALGKLKMAEAWRSFRKIFRFPRAMPKGLAKFLILKFVPSRTETWLRQRFVKQ